MRSNQLSVGLQVGVESPVEVVEVDRKGKDLSKEDDRAHRPGILYVLPRFDLETDTHFYHIYQLLELLAEQFDIHLIVERGDLPPAGRFASIQVLPSHGAFLKGRRAWATLRTACAARTIGCRLVYTHYSYYGGILASLVFRITGGQALYWNCGLVSEFRLPWRSHPLHLLKKAYKELPLWATLKIVSALVTGTESVGRHYLEHCGVSSERIEVVPNWIDLARFDSRSFDRLHARRQLGISSQSSVLLFVHRIVSRKGADRLVPIMEHVLQMHSDSMLLVVGSGPDEEILLGQVASALFQDHIRLVGSVPNHCLGPYLATADVFLMPSRQEGFPRVLLEAMAMGLPFVATDVGGVRDVTSPLQQQLIVSHFTPQAFAERVVTILRDTDLAERLRADGLRWVQAYSLEIAAANFAALWERYLS